MPSRAGVNRARARRSFATHVVFLHDLVAVFGEHLVHAAPHRLVVRLGNREEVDAAAAQLGDRVELIVRPQSQLLHARGVVVPVDVLLDLALRRSGSSTSPSPYSTPQARNPKPLPHRARDNQACTPNGSRSDDG